MLAVAIFVALSISSVYGSTCAGFIDNIQFSIWGAEFYPFGVCLVTSLTANSTSGGDYEAVQYTCANGMYKKTSYMTKDCSDTGMADAEVACDAAKGCTCDGTPCAYDQETTYETCDVEADGFEREYMIPDVCFKTEHGFYKWSCKAWGDYSPDKYLDNGCTEMTTPAPTKAPQPTPAPVQVPTNPPVTLPPTSRCTKWRDCKRSSSGASINAVAAVVMALFAVMVGN